jgi:flavin-dependent dehydrogenase
VSYPDRVLWDAIVIGAGPAGSVAARQLALDGASVLLVDRKSFPRRKVCGACWSASGLHLLKTLGAGETIESLGGVTLRQLHLLSPSEEVRVPMPAGLAISRAAMDAALANHAIEAGVCFRPNVGAEVGRSLDHARQVSLYDESGAGPVRQEARLVIAADGLGHPSLSELPEFACHAVRGSRIGAGCEIADFPDQYDAGTIHMAVGRDGYVGLVVGETGVLNVAAALAPALLRQHGSLAKAAAAVLKETCIPALPAIGAAEWRGTPLLTRHESRLAATRLFLIGDAAGYPEPFTGEGMTWAVLAACAVRPLALKAWQDWRPEFVLEWSAVYRRLIGRRQLICRGVAGLLRSPFAVARLTQLLKLAPSVASPMVRFFCTAPGAGPISRRKRYELLDSRSEHRSSAASDEPG